MNHPGLPHESWTPSEGPPRGRGWLVAILLLPALIFAAFAAYAWLAPATYRAAALITVQTAAGSPGPGVPPNAAQRLRDAAVEPTAIAQVARELALGESPAALAEADRRVRDSFELVATGTQTFEVRFTGPDPERAQRLCNLLARGAAAKATQALGGSDSVTGSTSPTRKQRVAELDAFLAAHPELGPPTVSPVAPGTPGKDEQEAKLTKLRVERDQLQGQIAKLATEADSDNPYAEASSNEAKRLQKRVEEINGLLRRAAEKKPATAVKASPEVEREWQRLREAVAAAGEDAPVRPAALLTVRLSEAGLPTSPIDPNRNLILLIGIAAALLVAGALGVLRVTLRPRRALTSEAEQPSPDQAARTRSSRPPPKISSDPPARYGSDPAPRMGSDPAPRMGSDPAPRMGSDPAPRMGSDPAPRPNSDPPPRMHQPLDANTQTATGAHPAAARAPFDPSAPLQPAVTHVVGAVGDRRQQSLSGFAIVPAPMRTPLPPQPPPPQPPPQPPPEAQQAPRAAEAAEVVAPPPTARIPAVAAPRPSGGPPTSGSMRPPAMRPSPADQPTAVAGILVSTRADAGGSRTSSGPGARRDNVGGIPNRTLTGPFSPTHGAPQEAEQPAPKGRGRTTQMLGSPIQPVHRNSRPPPAAPRASNPPSPQQRPSGYSYVNSAPPPAVQPHNRPTPAYFSTPPAGDTAGYLSTPVPTHAQSSAPPGQDRATRPAIATRPVLSSWHPHASIKLEAQRQLADQLFPLAVEKCFVIGVTAVPEAREGKTRISVELALALGEARHPRVLLVEGDFQWPSLHTVLQVEMPRSAGFSQQLRDRATGTPDQWTVLELGPSLHLMAEGIMRSPGLILSSHFEDALHSFRSYYDFVIVDGPLTSSEIDCRAFDAVIDGVVIVSSHTAAASLSHAVTLFPDKRFSTVVAV